MNLASIPNHHGNLPNGYQGNISITMSGYECKSWLGTRYELTVGQNHSYCRSPDNDSIGAWCYTTNLNMRWGYCGFPINLSGSYSKLYLKTNKINLIFMYLGTSGEIALFDYDNDYTVLWKVQSNCNTTRLFSTAFDTERVYDWVIINSQQRFSGGIVFDLIVSNTFFVGFMSDHFQSGSNFGFVLKWECHDKGTAICLK